MNYQELAKYDFCVMIDKSGSMVTADCPGGKSRWDNAKEYAESIATVCAKYDSDGIDVVLFANNVREYDNVTPDKVHQIFVENSPGGGTDTAGALEQVLSSFRKRKASGTFKPLIVVVVTDGEPNDQQAVASTIVNHTKSMDLDEETGITFVQIGKDAGARSFLEYLDNNLTSQGAKFDIVDCKNADEMDNISIDELLLEAITD